MSLTGKYDQQNIFAKILRGEIPYAKVYEDEHILAFMDAFPQSPCHTLVIPKKPSRNLFDIEPQQLTAVITGVQKFLLRSKKPFLLTVLLSPSLMVKQPAKRFFICISTSFLNFQNLSCNVMAVDKWPR